MSVFIYPKYGFLISCRLWKRWLQLYKRVWSSSGQFQNCVWLGTNRNKNSHLHDLLIGNRKSVRKSRVDHFLSTVFFVLSREKRTLDKFRRWNVPELKEFLRNRGLKTTGIKGELTQTRNLISSVLNSRSSSLSSNPQAGDIVLTSWARHFTLTVPFSNQVYKWVPANVMLG